MSKFYLEINILERIRRYLDETGEYPWPVGFNVNTGSKEALIAWRMLSVSERLAISKNNYFVPERNSVLLGLRAQGYSQSLLSELSGLAPVTIKRLSPKKKAKHE